jgi:hypothetical protein
MQIEIGRDLAWFSYQGVSKSKVPLINSGLFEGGVLHTLSTLLLRKLFQIHPILKLQSIMSTVKIQDHFVQYISHNIN